MANPHEKFSVIQTAGTSRARSVAYWLVTCLVFAETALGAVWDLKLTPFVVETVQRLGYPTYFVVIMGLWKVPGAVVLVSPRLPRLKEWVYAGLIFVYTTAAASHLVMHEVGNAIAPIVLTLLTLASWALRPASRRDFVSK
jgi:uncharacterized membrane protein YphA (DoxX/SURF4 family)